MYRMKKTKIVATMSDFRCTEEFVKQLFDAGMDVVRVNLGFFHAIHRAMF